ncbi:F0F1 ATP synthase subunit A [Acuticoccus kandeliae]|uniref:F0F1 ATP synthase subunit A n=1 Tax=Acuticoccus kandeliae TaxID=2073160 RepID=UPI000D3ECF54|nr:F0F1 ATP synthase subunit A [Acuticoccus kandeliae]
MATTEGGGLDPIHQFEVKPLIDINVGGVDLSFTNVSLFMLLATGVTLALMLLPTNKRALVPGRWQNIAELAYEFSGNMLRSSAGAGGMRFFPLVFSLFMFILIANFIGMFPYFYTVTSQLIVTLALALIVILTVVIAGIRMHGLSFFRVFVPSGVPGYIIPLVSAIEVISFLSRPISLSVRLFANMLAGHIMLKVFAAFVVSMSAFGAIGVVGAVLPLGMTLAITALEFLVAALQAYVFAVLTCIYLNDAVHPHH